MNVAASAYCCGFGVDYPVFAPRVVLGRADRFVFDGCQWGAYSQAYCAEPVGSQAPGWFLRDVLVVLRQDWFSGRLGVVRVF
jgi:hypothetical protein